MMMRKWGLLVAAAAIAMPGGAMAHRQWMMPSSTVLSGNDQWVTVDAAVSNDLFYFEHVPMRLDGMTVIAPDGTQGKIENPSTGRYRSTFDVHLTQKGTYKIETAGNSVMASYKLNGEVKRVPRGTTKEGLAAALPKGATDVKTSESSNRNEIFVTVGEPTKTVFKPTGVGLELVPVTHPNDLVAGEAATFQFLLDGKPAAGLAVAAIPGGIRYRDSLEQMNLKTGADGKVTITWPTPGMYWLNVTTGSGREGGPEGGPGGGAGGPGGPGGAGGPGGMGGMGAPGGMGGPAGEVTPGRRASYITTLEVLAP